MSIAEIALIVSIASAIVASLSLGWNIYRDIVLKAKVDVSFAVVTLIDQARADRPQFLNLKAVNFGPGVVTISTIIVKDAPAWHLFLRPRKLAIITPDYTNPLSAKLPAKMEVGDKIELLLPYDREAFLKEAFTHVGLSDYFGRIHWAPLKDYAKVSETWEKDFSGSRGRAGARPST
jgi:hypothetical protein